MQTVKEAADAFLAQHRIAVTGVSRHPESHGANVIYRRLKERGYEVFAVNPNTAQVEGDPAFHDLKSIPGGVDAVVIGTRAELAQPAMHECVDLGIHYVWMHRSVGKGSVSKAAADYGREHGVHVIDGGCPLMFDPVADGPHKAMRYFFTLTGKVPRQC
jgi:predicted CoA-binding protein